MGSDGHCNEHIACRTTAGRGHALAAQPDLLAVLNAGRDLELDLFADRQLDAARAAMGGFIQRDGCSRGDILPAHRRADIVRLEGCARSTAAAHPEHLTQDVLEAGPAGTATTRA